MAASPTFNIQLQPNNLFSVILETKLSRTIKDTQPATELDKKPRYTHTQALARYKEITNNETTFDTFSSKTEFVFDNYAADGKYYQNEDTNLYIKEYALSRDIGYSYPNFAKFLNNAKLSTESMISKNKIKVTLNPKIPRLGLNFGETKTVKKNREDRKGDLNEILNKGNNKINFRRIVKIMAFILSRERGSSIDKSLSSNELLQREYGLMCWAIVNAAKAGRFQCNGDILTLLKDLNYTNPYKHVKANDDIKAENETMTNIYKDNMGIPKEKRNNLELFVMAFWDGYINDELNGYTNWSHVVNKRQYDENGNFLKEIEFTFKNFQLPDYFKRGYDPDAVVDNSLTYKLSGQGLNESSIKIDSSNRELFKITKTSAGDIFTLDGRVIFLKS